MAKFLTQSKIDAGELLEPGQYIQLTAGYTLDTHGKAEYTGDSPYIGPINNIYTDADGVLIGILSSRKDMTDNNMTSLKVHIYKENCESFPQKMHVFEGIFYAAYTYHNVRITYSTHDTGIDFTDKMRIMGIPKDIAVRISARIDDLHNTVSELTHTQVTQLKSLHIGGMLENLFDTVIRQHHTSIFKEYTTK